MKQRSSSRTRFIFRYFISIAIFVFILIHIRSFNPTQHQETTLTKNEVTKNWQISNISNQVKKEKNIRKRVPVRSSDMFQYNPLYKKHPKVLIIILTFHKNFERRKIQRDSWLQELPPHMSYMYILGNRDTVRWDSPEQKLSYEKEYKQNSDMLETKEVVETYRNIGEKVFWSFEWASQFDVEYIVKTDDDLQLKTYMLMQIFEQRPKNELYAYWGYVYDNKYPVRDEHSQWYLSKSDYPLDSKFPAYCCGGFYFLSKALAVKVSQKFREPNFKIFPFEDIQMGMVVNSLGYKPEHNKNIFYCDGTLSVDRSKELFYHFS